MSKADFVGRWRITWMKQWDPDYIDLITSFAQRSSGGVGVD